MSAPEVEKPEGFDLRDARADKSHDAKDWTPADALYSASESQREKPAVTLVVAWTYRDAKGDLRLSYCNASKGNEETIALLAAMNHKFLNMYADVE